MSAALESHPWSQSGSHITHEAQTEVTHPLYQALILIEIFKFVVKCCCVAMQLLKRCVDAERKVHCVVLKGIFEQKCNMIVRSPETTNCCVFVSYEKAFHMYIGEGPIPLCCTVMYLR